MKAGYVLISGLAGALLTAILATLVSNLTGYNVITFSFGLVLPLGALLCGFFASLGFLWGSLHFRQRPNLTLLVQMVITAGATQLLIYYFGYLTLVLDDGRHVANVMSFGDYLPYHLTNARYSGRSMETLIGNNPVGWFGYYLAFFHFAGLVVSEVTVFFLLRAKPFCNRCDTPMKRLKVRQKIFPDMPQANSYFKAVLSHPAASPAFAALLTSEPRAEVKMGAVEISTSLFRCPHCQLQAVKETVRTHNGRDWDSADKMDRQIDLPEGFDMQGAFENSGQ